ncbi:MAG: T9SS type A sorting domain-containing protein, partial [Bacteroidales bacterium]|nr:T9SS type A sorting domain-containing protein [Bacteroidales bacterium]
ATHCNFIDVEIYDIMGRMLKCPKTINSNEEILMDISGFPAGVYSLRILTDSGVVAKKVVKQ